MSSLEELLALREMDAAAVAAALGVEEKIRESITGYEGLSEVDALDDGPGIRCLLRGEEVILVYVGRSGLPAGLDHDALVAAAGSEGRSLRSRQGKRAELHVVADAGLAWSEVGGEVGFLELFPPTTFEHYRATIYQEPPPFKR